MRPRLQAFPSADAEFVAFASAAWERLGEGRTPEGLQDELRSRYPLAVVMVQDELARHPEDPPVWYAFRMGAVVTRDARPPADPPESWPAFAILDDERRFLEVSPEFAGIAEVPAEMMIGRRLDAFSNPADPTIREDIERLWLELRQQGELSSTIRFNFRSGRPRELAYHARVNGDGPGRHRLSVRVLPR